MPCPEAVAWGGVLKRLMLRLYGQERRWHHWQRWLLLPAVRGYTRFIYRRLAKRIARDIDDYVRSGFEVVGIMGVRNSPSCGVLATLDLGEALRRVMTINPDSLDARAFNDQVVRPSAPSGEGLYVTALRRQLRRRHLHRIPFLEHQPEL
jgi:hypothetical protein